MRLRGIPPEGVPSISYVGSPTGSIVGSAQRPIGRIISIPGSPGGPGPANSLTIGTVVGGASAAATITGTAPTQVLNLVLPEGDPGDPGVSLNIAGSVATYGDLPGSASLNDAYEVLADGKLYVYNSGWPASGSGLPWRGAPGVGSGVVISVVAGSNIDVDSTDPANPIVSVETLAISDITSLQTSLDAKVDENSSITGATKTKITYDAKGLVTAGANATQDDIADGTTNRSYTATEKTKLSGIATGATANDTDTNLKARANHTGTQSADTVVDGTTNHVFTAADDTKLGGIESLADVTDATNVAAAGAVMKSGSATGLWMGSTLPGSGSTGILYVVTP